MSRPWTEKDIKDELDGTFTRFNAEGRVVTRVVEKDHKPDHEHKAHNPEGGRSRQNYQPWTKHEDIMLLELRARRQTIPMISKWLNRSEDSVTHRVRHLMARARGDTA